MFNELEFKKYRFFSELIIDNCSTNKKLLGENSAPDIYESRKCSSKTMKKFKLAFWTT